ncbi:MAG: type VI secretion system ImpA family N-terminal domain-containing protein [Paracoccaceae bacterium]
MRVDDLLKPVTPDAPCGEDLLAADDPDFIDYYFNVEDRLPSSYFNLVRNELFDPRSIDQKGEAAQIDALLSRTRDIRLLVLDAKFQILSGRFKGFSDAVQSIAAVMEAWPDEVHPADTIDRRNALEELDAVATVIAPLEYAPLISDRRIGDIAYRPYGTATGRIAAREGEAKGDASTITGALGSSDNSAAVETLHAQVAGIGEALRRIAAVTRAGAEPFAPTVKRLEERLGDIAAMIAAARSDLGGEAPSAGDVSAEGDAGAGPDAATAVSGAQTVVIQAIAGISDHRMAYRILAAVEGYFARNEPASLALVLVTQSRLLIGRPLVEAIDALLPNQASSAQISFGSEQGFGIHMSRMRDLSGYSGLPDSSTFQETREDDPPVPEVVSRDHAGQLLKQVEDFFRSREPASPIPILLFKARNMLTKDFHDLVRDLLGSRG